MAGLRRLSELDVDPELFYEVAGAYSRASRSASAALLKLDRELRAAVKMSGSDSGGRSWGGTYFKSAVEALVTAGMATRALAQMAALVRQSGVNHDQSEQADSYNTPGGKLPDADPGSQTAEARPPKNPAGGTRAEPSLWKDVMGAVEWIDGDADLMENAANSWIAAASSYQALDDAITPKMKSLLGSTSEEIPTIGETHTTVFEGVSLLADAMRQQGGATSGYAGLLRLAQEDIEWELRVEKLVQAVNDLNAATIGKPIEKAIKVVAELEIAYSRRQIENVLTGLTNARDMTATILTGVSTTVVNSVNTKFKPVLDKQLKRPPEPTSAERRRKNKLEGAKAEARAGIDPTKPKTSIPSASGTASRRIPDDLDTTNKRLTEVKNVERQEYTDQIKDFVSYCETNGYEFVLVTDKNTKLASEIQDLINQGKIKHVPMDFKS
ncbi:putative toxin [Nocardia brasiliensis]|uniref:putative toxin n=1 Tax=Nocardia brasiliensis TaxID=37326 RepID=UPI0024566BD2|nr:putative toxin [Nocardia brasiliensis]